MHFVGIERKWDENDCNINMVLKGWLKIVDVDAVSQVKVGAEEVDGILFIEMELVHLRV